MTGQNVPCVGRPPSDTLLLFSSDWTPCVTGQTNVIDLILTDVVMYMYMSFTAVDLCSVAAGISRVRRTWREIVGQNMELCNVLAYAMFVPLDGQYTIPASCHAESESVQ